MITATINSADLDKLAQKPELFIQAVARKVRKFILMLQRKIVDAKLQSQVLQHRSGKLGRSIKAMPVVIDGDVVAGTVDRAGPSATYGVYAEQAASAFTSSSPRARRC
jgi:CBS-domain-containing membrane protein